MGTFLRGYGRSLVDPKLALTAAKVAVTVGSLLLLINHGAAIANGQMSRGRWISALLTYVVPYLVSIHGQYVSQKSNQK
jgi:hypothetical protein